MTGPLVSSRMLEFGRLLGHLVAGLFKSRRALVLENLALRHQLGVALRISPHPQVRRRDRMLWVALSRLWAGGWRDHVMFVKPATVIGWHRKGWRLYWSWRSRSHGGRPRLSPEIKDLITEMWHSNPLWGSERIRGELEKLGIIVSNRSIRRYRGRNRPPAGDQRWRTFLMNELAGIWAADFFVVQTMTMRTVYVLFFITHARRELVQCSITTSPTAAWVWQQFINATPWGLQPQHLIHDRDAVYGKALPAKLASIGVRSVRTPVRAPRANGIAERVIRTIRQECLDHVIVLNEQHLRAVLKDFVAYYNEDRPHRTLRFDSPVSQNRNREGPISRRPVLGGLHHVYARAA